MEALRVTVVHRFVQKERKVRSLFRFFGEGQSRGQDELGAGPIRELVRAEPLATLSVDCDERASVVWRDLQLVAIVGEVREATLGAFEYARHLVRLVLAPHTVDQTLARERRKHFATTIA